MRSPRPSPQPRLPRSSRRRARRSRAIPARGSCAPSPTTRRRVWAAGWIATALAAFHLRSLARNASRIGIAIRTAAHLCAPPLLWLAAMHAGAWFEWPGPTHPHRLGTDWFYAEMYHEYLREPGGLVLTASIAAAVAVPLATVLAAWLACACFARR